MIAALYVDRGGPYFKMPDVDPWDVERDARKYVGPHAVVAHPPCERWGRYWGGGPSARVKRNLGDDDGCFHAALCAVYRYGGVLEHPEGSHAFRHFGLTIPRWREGWVRNVNGGFVCCVAQGHYGHRARKLTWLFTIGPNAPEPLDFSIPAPRARLDYGFHSAEERKAKRADVAPRVNADRLRASENHITPPAFAEYLVRLARAAGEARRAA